MIVVMCVCALRQLLPGRIGVKEKEKPGNPDSFILVRTMNVVVGQPSSIRGDIH